MWMKWTMNITWLKIKSQINPVILDCRTNLTNHSHWIEQHWVEHKCHKLKLTGDLTARPKRHTRAMSTRWHVSHIEMNHWPPAKMTFISRLAQGEWVESYCPGHVLEVVLAKGHGIGPGVSTRRNAGTWIRWKQRYGPYQRWHRMCDCPVPLRPPMHQHSSRWCWSNPPNEQRTKPSKPITSAKGRGWNWNGHRFLCVPHRSWGFNVCNEIRQTCFSKVIDFCVTPIVPESFMIVSSINVLVSLFQIVGGFGGPSNDVWIWAVQKLWRITQKSFV